MSSHEALNEKTVEKIDLALCQIELQALQQILDAKFNEPANIAHVAHFAMWFALQQPEQFNAWLNAQARYCKAEGLHQFTHARGRLAATYRRKRRLA